MRCVLPCLTNLSMQCLGPLPPMQHSAPIPAQMVPGRQSGEGAPGHGQLREGVSCQAQRYKNGLVGGCFSRAKGTAGAATIGVTKGLVEMLAG